MKHYRILHPVQRDGYPYHPDGELSYLDEFDAAKLAEWLADGTLEAVDGALPDAPPPAPAPEPAPVEEVAPDPAPEYHEHYTGPGDPPPGTWEYIWQQQGAQPPPAEE